MPEPNYATLPILPGHGKNYLLAIAIDNYRHYNKLNNAVKDVTEITNILVNLYQFEKQHLFTLFNEDATEDGIDEILLELVDVVKKEDNLVILFSGHGYFRHNVREGYWVPVDGRKDKVSDYISNANLTRYIETIEAHHLLLIVDSCFSGALIDQLKGDTNSEGFPSRRILASGREETTDGIPGENSPFAKGIIDFLMASLTSPEPVSTSALIDSVGSYVKSKTGQKPIEGRLTYKDNKGEFFFKQKMSEEDLWKTVYARGKMEDYEEFLSIFPNGAFSSEAREQIDKLHALIVWRKAEKGNTIDDYQDFIFLCSKSELVKRAKAKIEQLEKAQEQERLKEEEDAKKTGRIEKKNLGLIKEYELAYFQSLEAFKNKNYQKARSLLWICKRCYREDKKELYIPEIGIIINRQEECIRQIRYIQHLRLGKKAFKIKNFNLAYTHFDAALAINSTGEIKRLRHAAHTLNKTQRTITVRATQQVFAPKLAQKTIKTPLNIRTKKKIRTTIAIPPFDKRKEKTEQHKPILKISPKKGNSFPKLLRRANSIWVWVAFLIITYIILGFAFDLF